MPFEPRNIGELIASLACDDPTAFAVEQDGHRHSRADIFEGATGLAQYFHDQGISHGAAIGLVPVNRLRCIQAMIALWSVDAAVLFLDPRQTGQELDTARMAAGLDAIYSDAPSMAKRTDVQIFPEPTACCDNRGSLSFSPGSEHRDALILSSSGTTGVPRFRRQSHTAILNGIATSNRILNINAPLPHISVGSLSFGAVLMHWIKLLIHGVPILSLPLLYRPIDLHNALSRVEFEAIGLPPVVIRDLLAFHKDRHLADGPVYPHIRRMGSVGGPIAPNDLVRAFQMLTPGVMNIYSMSGVGAVSVLEGSDILTKSKSVGKPLTGVTVRVEDDAGHPLPHGQVGHLVATADWMTDAQPVRTDDMGWIDADGYLFVAGRAGQVACRNAININLRDLEQDVKSLDWVRDCIAFALTNGHGPDDAIYLAIEARGSTDAMKSELKRAISPQRRPDKILISPSLARNASNKLSLRVLRAIAEGKEQRFVDF